MSAAPPDEPRWRRLLPRLWRGELVGLAPHRRMQFGGAALVADLIGFTPLTTRLEARGAEGSEALSGLLDAAFVPLVDIVEDHGGDVVSFSGDALTAVFPDQPGLAGFRRAMRAATLIRRTLAPLASTKSLGIPAALRFRLGLGAGALQAELLGAQTGGPEGTKGPDANMIAFWHGDALAEAWRNCRLDRTALSRPARPAAAVPARLHEKLPAGMATRLLRAQQLGADAERGGFRPVGVLFARWFSAAEAEAGITARRLRALHAALREAQADSGMMFSRLEVSDKGLVAMWIAGAPQARDGDEKRLLALAARLRRLRISSLPRAALGATAGIAYCGLAGGPRRAEYTVMGECVNLAARLTGAARAGELLTHGFQAGREEAGASSRLTLKGITAPVTAARHEDGGLEAAPVRLAGRDAEIARLADLIRGNPPCRWLLVSGAAGIGKSALLQAALAAAPADATGTGITLRGECGHPTRGAAYYPWRALVRGRLGLAGVPGHQLAARLGERLSRYDLAAEKGVMADLFGLGNERQDRDKDKDKDAAQRRARLHRAIARLFRMPAGLPAPVIVIEDIHWIDEASAGLAAALLALPDGPRFIFTKRPEEGAALPVSWPGAGVEIHLPQLSGAAIGSLTRQAVGTNPPAWFSAWLLDRGGGNPLFTLELIEAVRRGVLSRVRLADLDPSGLENERLPRSLSGLILARLDALPAASRAALQAASILGRRVSGRLLAGLHPGSQRVIERAMQPAIAAGLVEWTAEGRAAAWHFTHALFQAAIYESLPFSWRRELHGRAARALLARRGRDRRAALGQAVHHLHGAGELALLHATSAAAGRQAERHYANAEAAAFYETALAAWHKLPQRSLPDGLSLRLALGGLRVIEGDYARARRDYQFTLNAAGAALRSRT